jgi:hypothetical protein
MGIMHGVNIVPDSFTHLLIAIFYGDVDDVKCEREFSSICEIKKSKNQKIAK